MLKFGIDRAAEFAPLFAGRVALITAPSGRSSDNGGSIDVLRQRVDLRLLLSLASTRSSTTFRTSAAGTTHSSPRSKSRWRTAPRTVNGSSCSTGRTRWALQSRAACSTARSRASSAAMTFRRATA